MGVFRSNIAWGDVGILGNYRAGELANNRRRLQLNDESSMMKKTWSHRSDQSPPESSIKAKWLHGQSITLATHHSVLSNHHERLRGEQFPEFPPAGGGGSRASEILLSHRASISTIPTSRRGKCKIGDDDHECAVCRQSDMVDFRNPA